MRMSEQETLAEGLVDALQALVPPNVHGQLCPIWAYRSKRKTKPSDCDCWQRPRCVEKAGATLSWLASVLADDATVEVVRAAIWPLSLDASPATNAMCDEATVRALTALSAHLAPRAVPADGAGGERDA